MKIILGSALVLMTTALPLLASDTTEHQALTLVQLQAKCTELASNPQIQPFKPSVTCNMTSFKWVPAQAGSFTLKSQKVIGASIQMKSFYVPQESQTLDDKDFVQPCGVFQKISDNVSNVDVEVSCEELGVITDLAAFCEPHVVRRIGEDPALVTSRETGEVYTLCGQGAALAPALTTARTPAR